MGWAGCPALLSQVAPVQKWEWWRHREDASGFSEDILIFAKYKVELKALRSKNDPNYYSSRALHSVPPVVDIIPETLLGLRVTTIELGIRLVGLGLSQVFLADEVM